MMIWVIRKTVSLFQDIVRLQPEPCVLPSCYAESQDERWLPFLDFHQYLNDTFPLV